MAQQLTEMGLISGAQFMDAGPMIQKYRPDPVPVPTKEYPYEDVHIGGLYAPWNVKEDFADAYRMVKDNTLVDIHRLWNLWSLQEGQQMISYLEKHRICADRTGWI